MIDIVYNKPDILSALCKHKNKWGMYISSSSLFNNNVNGDWDGLMRAAPYLRKDKHLYHAFLHECELYMFFDSEEEMNEHYHQTVGQDGPTALNTYDGTARVYAMTCNNLGQTLKENT